VTDRALPRSLVLATVVGLLLRVLWPEARPVHHDESVNWYFVNGVLRSGWYDYDPANYHGPLFFYLTAPGRLLGRGLLGLRLPTMLLSAAMVPAVWPLRRRIGVRAAVLSGWALALSPSLVFFGRDAIHETTLAAASLGAVVFAVRWLDDRREHDALWAGLCVGAMLTTKETSLITFGAWGVGGALAWLAGGRARWPGRRDVGWALLGVVVLFVPLYAGFGRHMEGLSEAFEAFFRWSGRGLEGGGHDKAWWVWPKWLGVSDGAIAALAAVGLIAAAVRRDPWAVFAAGWLLSTVGVYSWIGYKTPWCILQAALPLALLGGWGAAWLLRHRIGAAAVVLLLLSSFARAVDFSFVRPEDPDAPLVYVQTRRELVETMAVARAVLDSEEGTSLRSYQDARYPMNWLLDRPGLTDEGELPERLEGDVIITAPGDRRRAEGRLAGPFLRKSTLFRQGLRLEVWIDARHRALVPEGWEAVGPAAP
jgi:uncharacterized protein (TIGR03663 family)